MLGEYGYVIVGLFVKLGEGGIVFDFENIYGM